MSTIDRAAEVIFREFGKFAPGFPVGTIADDLSLALADAGRLRPHPSSRYDGQYETTFSRDEDAGDGPYIDASVDKHHSAPKWEIVHRANVSLDVGGQYGYNVLQAYATAEWCREAAAVLLDVADEVDRKNKETADKRAEKGDIDH